MGRHPIASLKAPRTVDRSFYRFDAEANYHHAFKAQRSVANVLAAANLHHDALLNLHFSIECFLKYLYCLVREREVPEDLYANPMTSDIGKSLAAKERFTHDLRAIATVLSAHTDLTDFQEYKDFERVLPSSTGWIDERYSVRNHEGRKARYQTLSGFFNEFLEGCVRHLV